jgi:hypothetical protein
MGGNIVSVLLLLALSGQRVAGKVGMLLGPEGTGPALLGAGFVVSSAGCGSLCSYRFLTVVLLFSGFPGCGVGGLKRLVGRYVGFVGWWVFVNWIVDASIL